MSSALDESVIYEQPLNERMRAFLRLEHLFKRVDHQMRAADPWSSRSTLEALIDIISLIARVDLKHELIKELERHANTLEALAKDHRVDQERLTSILKQVRELVVGLRATEGALGSALKGNELLNTIRQRSSIPAGTCDFDVPTFRYWLNQTDDKRHHDLTHWLSPFDLARRALELCLELVRESAAATREHASGGFFQKNLDAQSPCQLVRVALPRDTPCFTEISAGKHRFTVRFMRQDGAEQRASQTADDIDFQLLCCFL
ncbi:MAG: cell division protein ZapD [Gammaproteobacteria bacterium]|nr:cell division protein ZapD [Gammaproteobacteria bacterium]